MNISEILSVERVFCNKEVESKKVALEELSKILASADTSLDYIDIFNCLITREKLGSTGLGKGIAIPHGRLIKSSNTVGAFLQLKNSINFDSIDQKPVDLIFALLVPEDTTNEHLQILATLAEKFSDNILLEKIRNENSPDNIYRLITG